MENDFFKRKTLEVLMDSESILVLGFEDALLGYSEIGDSIVAAYDQDTAAVGRARQWLAR